MKIVSIILTSQNGGAEQVFIDYSRILKDSLGHEVLAITKHDAPYVDQLSSFNIPVKKIKNNFGYHDIFAINQIKKILQEFDADTVIAHAGRSMILARKAIKKIKGKKIFEVAVNHSMNVKRSIGADVVISINRPMFFSTIDRGQDESKSFVVHNAIDGVEKFAASTPVPKINLQNKDVITLGIIGRLDKAKGFRYAVKAVKLLENHPSGKKFILKIAGTGMREPFFRSLVKELQIEDRVEFLGWIKDKKAFFDSIDIFLLTSQRETFGLVVLEAMKFRKPIIACDADGPKEILRNEIDGLLISLEPLQDTEYRIVEAIEKLIENPELVNKMIENSFIRLREKFSFEALTARLKEIFGTAK